MAEGNTDFPVAFSCKIIEVLRQQFRDRFSDLDSKTDEIRLFQNPIEADVATCPDALQMEVIELQANDLLRDKFKEGLLHFINFYLKRNFPI